MKICNLSKSFPSFSLSIDSLTIDSGKICGLIGANGCGKSTLMKLLAGVLKPDSGVIDHSPFSQKDITLLPRKPYMLHDTVRNNLVYPLKLRKLKADDSEISSWLSTMGLAGRANDYAPALSGGEQQKLAFARALIFSPKLVLVDEGMSNMDLESIAMLEELIKNRQQRDPITWVIVSHQLAHIKRLCQDVCFMSNGKIIEQGSCESLLTKPQSAQFKNFLQSEAITVEGD